MHRNYWQTDKVLLRAFEHDDVERVVRNRNAKDSNLFWLYDAIKLPRTPEQIRDEYEKMLKDWEKEDRCLLCIENSEADVVGDIIVWQTKLPERYFVYGVQIEEKWQRKGYAKDALKILLDFYFNELGYNKVEASVYGYNAGSQSFHERFGFTLEGILRNRLHSRGRYHDTLIYGMLKEEFNAIHEHDRWRKK